MAQTTITAAPDAAIAGTFATGKATPLNSSSAIAAETITVGKLVVLTAGGTTCELPDGAGEPASGRALGIALRPASGATSYASGETVTIGHTGEFWVEAQAAVAAGNQATIRVSAGGDGLGSFDDVDDASMDPLPNAVYRSAGGAGALVKVWLSGPFI